MKALVLHRQGPAEERPLGLADLPDPRPAPGEVLVEVRACGVCRTDLHLVEGDLPLKLSPIVPGHQVVGRVVAAGPGTGAPAPGSRVGVAWLHKTCGACSFCLSDRENLCDDPLFTGWTAQGGFAGLIRAPAAFCHSIPEGFGDLEAAPLLCAGIIGYRALALAGLSHRGPRPPRLGIYGFGAAGHVVIQLARARGAEVFVCTRDRERHQPLASELGASWVGGASEQPPERLDASILFAPAGALVPTALEALSKGGTLVLGGIHMDPTPPLPYDLLYGERVLRSVANNTRADARAFLAEAARIGLRTSITTFPLEQGNEALQKLKADGFRGAAVLVP